MNDFNEYELNLLGVDEFHTNSNSSKRFWYDHIRSNACSNDGDIFEFGVFQGRTILAVGIILKELKSKKKIFGFDSFEGFPEYSKYDELDAFYEYPEYFDKKFILEFERFKSLKEKLNKTSKLDKINAATSLDFSSTSLESIKEKIEYLKLDNIELIKGPFSSTVNDFFDSNKGIKVSSCNIDCDLYDGYKTVLPFVYNHLSPHGYIHLDEYYSFKYPGAKIACDQFFDRMKIKPLMQSSRKGEFERWYLTK